MMSLFKKKRVALLFYSLLGWQQNVLAQGEAELNPVQGQQFDEQSLQQLAVEHVIPYVNQHQDAELTIEALPINSTQVEFNCHSELVFVLPNDKVSNRQASVQIKCNDEKSWHVFVHLRIKQQIPVVVAKNGVKKGDRITDDDLTIKLIDKHLVRLGYEQNPELLIGSRATRNLNTGFPVSQNNVCTVCKGDKITIFAGNEKMLIKTSGIALENGQMGDNIKVENAKSGKEISARVIGVEQVKVAI